ncbi:gluconolaconase [Denitrobaculum tricleocarpae]|uniref:Gluconolaconase n=1 Tax=Denitrobaculum tricleocarpae TaxID=2591009 RepID=A0A545STC4_9PROT|nr:gluconolaconase [Denitrobaculum tricleocarpae]TQV68220.1 gluconolaconase [Denitrobaculum tricleocarpae]
MMTSRPDMIAGLAASAPSGRAAERHRTPPSRPGLRDGLSYLFCAFLITAALAGMDEAHAADSVREIPLPTSFDYPNGITTTPDGTLYVGSVTSGDILRITPEGTIERAFQETETVFAGTALRFDPTTGLLWVASPDFLGQEIDGEQVRRPHRIGAIDIAQRRVVWSSTLPDDGFANDMALDGTGGIYITDSIRDRILHLAAPGAAFETVTDAPLLSPGDLGPAGIVMTRDGDLIIGLYSEGALLRVTLDEAAAQVEPLELTRRIENPDGLALAPDGRLLVLEGAVRSGDGKLLVIDPNGPSPLEVETLADGLDMPLNLTLLGNEVAVSEGRLRHLMLDDSGLSVPEVFRIVVVPLDETSAAETGR